MAKTNKHREYMRAKKASARVTGTVHLLALEVGLGRPFTIIGQKIMSLQWWASYFKKVTALLYFC